MIFPQEELSFAFKVGFLSIPALATASVVIAWRARSKIINILSLSKVVQRKTLVQGTEPSEKGGDKKEIHGDQGGGDSRIIDPDSPEDLDLLVSFAEFIHSFEDPVSMLISDPSLENREKYNTLLTYYKKFSYQEKIRLEVIIQIQTEHIKKMDDIIALCVAVECNIDDYFKLDVSPEGGLLENEKGENDRVANEIELTPYQVKLLLKARQLT